MNTAFKYLRMSLIVVMLLSGIAAYATLGAYDLRVNYLASPAVIDRAPVFSWKPMGDSAAGGQSAYQIEVTDHDGTVVWNSGKIASDKPFGIHYHGRALKSSCVYRWRVRIWDFDGKEGNWSDYSGFETALLDSSEWLARWIEEDDARRDTPSSINSESSENTPGAIIFANDYDIAKKVRRARAYVSGLGVFSLEVNGNKVCDNVLEPLQTDYERSVIYSTYDITDHIGADGRLRFEATVAGGMYENPATERYSKINTIYGRKRFIMQVLLEYEDGTSEILKTDSSWKVSPSPTVFASWYGGEDFDATYKESFSTQARECSSAIGELRARFSPPLKVVEKWQAKEVRKLADGSYIVDFGTNIAGTYRFTLSGDKGNKICIYPCEALSTDGGHGQTNGSCGTPVFDCYTFAGDVGKEVWGPEFVYHGFRYLQIFGLDKQEPTVNDFEACVISSDVAKTGTFECSNHLLNKIHEITLRAIDSNLYSTLTDCPHREKLGWLEVPGLLYNTLAYNYDIAAWATKVCHDCRVGQHTDGFVPGVLPEYPDFGEYWLGDPSWGGTAIMLPYRHYLNHGDKSIILDNYATMKRLMDYYESRVVNGLLEINSLGDWGAYDKATSVQFVHNCVYYGLAVAMAEMASAIGNDEDAVTFNTIAGRVREKTNERYYVGGIYDKGTQADYALPLYFGLVDEANKADVAARMAQAVINNREHLSTGEIALRPLILSLSEHGYGDIAMEMLTKTEYPGYGFFVEQGATSLPEHWNMDTASSSQNHCMMGHIEEWFYSVLAGIRPLTPGYRTFAINPYFSRKLDYAGAEVSTPYGKISSRWERSDRGITLRVDVPLGTHATLFLPDAVNFRVNGVAYANESLPEGIVAVHTDTDATHIIAAPGTYDIEFDD